MKSAKKFFDKATDITMVSTLLSLVAGFMVYSSLKYTCSEFWTAIGAQLCLASILLSLGYCTLGLLGTRPTRTLNRIPEDALFKVRGLRAPFRVFVVTLKSIGVLGIAVSAVMLVWSSIVISSISLAHFGRYDLAEPLFKASRLVSGTSLVELTKRDKKDAFEAIHVRIKGVPQNIWVPAIERAWLPREEKLTDVVKDVYGKDSRELASRYLALAIQVNFEFSDYVRMEAYARKAHEIFGKNSDHLNTSWSYYWTLTAIHHQGKASTKLDQERERLGYRLTHVKYRINHSYLPKIDFTMLQQLAYTIALLSVPFALVLRLSSRACYRALSCRLLAEAQTAESLAKRIAALDQVVTLDLLQSDLEAADRNSARLLAMANSTRD
ncbi:MAG: hypothetical protein AB7W16_02600 [Candidatus Obscuribacterales bacterium]